jgi:hypothetical protein
MKLYPILLKVYLALSGAVFLLVGLFHFFRLVGQWPITVGTATIPQLLSYMGLPASIGCCVWAIWLFRRSSKERLSGPAA